MIINDKFRYKDLINSIKKANIKKGDSVFLTTNIALIGIPLTKRKDKIKLTSEWLLKSIKKIIGNKGNIFVPTYSYTFSSKKKKTFIPHKTKSKIGYFPNFFLKKKIIRSIDPMVSVSGLGPMVKNILLDASYTSYGKNSVFERMLKVKNLKCLTIGLGINWIPFVHYLDWLNNVPFRYDKFFKGYIKLKNKNRFFINWHYPVRYLRNKSTISDGYKLGNLAFKTGIIKESSISRCKIYSVDYKNYFEFCKKKTRTNRWLTANGK